MAQVLSQEGLGDILGQQLGQGFAQGANQGISSYLNHMMQKKKEFATIDDTIQKSYGKEWDFLDDKDRLKAIEIGRRNLAEGNSFQDSVFNARFHDELQKRQKDLQENQKTITQKALESDRPQESESPALSLRDVGQSFAKATRMLTRLADVNLANPNVFAQKFLPQAAGPSATEQLDKLTGGASVPNTVSQRIASEFFPFGISGVAFQGGIEAAKALGAPEWAQEGIGLLAALATEGAKIPAGKAAQKILDKAQKVAAEVGKPAGEILAEAQKTSGADFEKIAAGDASEINKLNRSITKEVPKVGEKVAETEKQFFNKKEALKQRETFGAKLPESPFEEYFAMEQREAAKLASKKPETLAKEAELTARVRPLENEKFAELQNQKSQLKELQSSRKGLQGNALERAESSIALKERQVQKTLEDLKDLQYELKYFRKRPTEAEIDTQIKKSADEFVKEAKNPTEAGQKKIQETLENDQKYIERAEKLTERGELPGEIRPDTHIKMKQKYLDGYNAMIKELREANQALKGSRNAESLKTISDNRKSIDYLQGRQRRLKADITNQTDKLKAMKAIEGPSGAFYRQQLKGLRQDVQQFQKDFFRQAKHIKTTGELKTGKVAQKEINELGTLANEIRKNPTPEKLEKLAEKAGIPKEQVKSAIDESKSIIKEGAEKGVPEKDLLSKIGNTWEKIGKETIKKKGSNPFLKYLLSVAKSKTLGKSIVFLALTGGGATTLPGYLKSRQKNKDIESFRKVLDTNDSSAKNRLINEFRAEGYTDARIKAIMQAAKARKKLEE